MRRARVARSAVGNVLVLLLAATALVGCGEDDTSDAVVAPAGDGEAGASASSSPDDEASDTGAPDTEATAATTTPPCGLLSAAEVSDLAGADVGPGIAASPGDGVRTCTFGEPPGSGLQVGAAAASAWAEALPGIVEQARPAFADDPESLEKIERAARLVATGSALDDTEACEVFRTIAIANGGPPESEVFASFFPDAEDAEYVSAQACRDGVFASLVVFRPDLAATAEQAETVTDALETVLARAVTG